MYRPWGPDEEWDEMEMDLEQDFAISRFMSESGCMDPACGLDEQNRDREKLGAWVDDSTEND